MWVLSENRVTHLYRHTGCNPNLSKVPLSLAKFMPLTEGHLIQLALIDAVKASIRAPSVP
jgi:hypothetical protein